MASILKGKIVAAASQFTELKSVISSVQYSTLLNSAIGAQLDGAGRLAGEPRNGRRDSDYRVAIKDRCGLNIACGTVSAVQKAAKKDAPQGTTVKIVEAFPKTLIIDAQTVSGAPGIADGYVSNVKPYKAGGTQLIARETVAGDLYLAWAQEGTTPPLPGGKYAEYRPDGTLYASGGKYQKVFVK